MKPKVQIALARDLSKTVADQFAAAVAVGAVPEEWDGHEIRVWLAEKHAESASMSMVSSEPRSKRARAYRNHVLTTPALF